MHCFYFIIILRSFRSHNEEGRCSLQDPFLKNEHLNNFDGKKNLLVNAQYIVISMLRSFRECNRCRRADHNNPFDEMKTTNILSVCLVKSCMG